MLFSETEVSYNIAIPSIHVIVLPTSRKAMGNIPKAVFIQYHYHIDVAAQPGSTVYETLFDSFNLIPSVSSRNLWTRNQRKFDFRSTWTQCIWTKYFPHSADAPGDHNVLVASNKVSGAVREPLGCLSPEHPCPVTSEQPKVSSSSIPAPSGYYSRGWSRVWSGSAPLVH